MDLLIEWWTNGEGIGWECLDEIFGIYETS